jgi:hypothetical protein
MNNVIHPKNLNREIKNIIQPKNLDFKFRTKKGCSKIIIIGNNENIITSLLYDKQECFSPTTTDIYYSVDTETINKIKNPSSSWALMILDDKKLNTPLCHEFFKNSSHWHILTIVTMKCFRVLSTTYRCMFDGIFILEENDPKTRKNIYENHGGIIPSFQLFNEYMDTLGDGIALFIYDSCYSTNWQECVFSYNYLS